MKNTDRSALRGPVHVVVVELSPRSVQAANPRKATPATIEIGIGRQRHADRRAEQRR